MRLPIFENKESYPKFIQAILYNEKDYKLDPSRAQLFVELDDNKDFDLLFMIREVYGDSGRIVLPNGRVFTLTETQKGVLVYYEGVETPSATERIAHD